MISKKTAAVFAAAAMSVTAPIMAKAETITCRELVDSYLEEQGMISTIPGMCEEIGGRYGISPELLESIIEQESRGDKDVENGGCIGLMQVSKKWHVDRMKRLGVTDLHNAYGNILVATDYLMDLFKESYNSGRGDDPYYVLMRYSMKKETADRQYDAGRISKYAICVVERAAELERERGK